MRDVQVNNYVIFVSDLAKRDSHLAACEYAFFTTVFVLRRFMHRKNEFVMFGLS